MTEKARTYTLIFLSSFSPSLLNRVFKMPVMPGIVVGPEETRTNKISSSPCSEEV